MTPAPTTARELGPARPARVTLPRVIASEWTKLASLRSTWWTLLIGVLLMIGLAALFAASIAMAGAEGVGTTGPAGPGGPLAGTDGVAISLNGVMLAQLAFGILGVLAISGEYSSGSIGPSLMAVPQRWPLLVGKAAVIAALTLTVGMVASYAAFGTGQALLAGTGLEHTLGDPGVVRAVAGAGAYLAVVSLLGVGLGALLRHTAGSMAALVGVLLLLTPLSAALPDTWQTTIGPYLPANAGEAVMAASSTDAMLAPSVALSVLIGYVLVIFGAAGVSLLRRDA